MSADLHIHSNLSDGTDSPEKIAELAAAAGLKTIALTDHDIVDGIEPARARGRELGVEVIPGIEFTTENPGVEIHILGYFIDFKSSALAAVLERIQRGRVERIYKIVEKLKTLGVAIEPEEVFAFSGKKAPGRPHVARALIKKGAVSSFKEAFNRYLDSRAPAYVSHYKLAPEEAVRLVVAAGGVPVYAHPGISNCDGVIPGLMAEGLRGLEVYYPSHDAGKTEHYLNLAKKYGLLVTGGSDFHGSDSGRELGLGGMTIADSLVEELKSEYLRRNQS